MIDIKLLKSLPDRKLKHVTSSETIITEGDKIGKAMYILLWGKVRVYKNYGRFGEIQLAELREGDFFGEMSVFLGYERTATVVADCDSSLLELGIEDAVEFFNSHPGVAYTIIVELCRRLDTLNKTAARLNTSKMDLLDKVYYDALTGIYNRRYIEEYMGNIIKSLSRSGGMLSVLMIDVDFFKKYNDTYGHYKGDACLKSIAEVLSGSIMRADDFVARYGGEEFAVILPNANESSTRIIANRILENIRACRIPHKKNGDAGIVTVSIGATSSKVEHTQTSDDYLKRADEAMYMSKQSGRNRYTYLYF